MDGFGWMDEWMDGFIFALGFQMLNHTKDSPNPNNINKSTIPEGPLIIKQSLLQPCPLIPPPMSLNDPTQPQRPSVSLTAPVPHPQPPINP